MLSFLQKINNRKAAENAEFQKNLNTVENRLSPINEKKINNLSDRMDEGKTITISQPKSQRFTFNRSLATSGPVRDNFKPKSEMEKASLSPNGFFMGDQLKDKREELKEEKIAQGKAKYKNLGLRWTANRAKEAVADAENARVYETEVPSTAIRKVKYDPKTESLYVSFTDSNKKYFYPRVPKSLIEKWMNAGSKGQFFLNNIHDQYTLNPGHKHSANVAKNDKINNYYKKMQKYYKNIRKTGKM